MYALPSSQNEFLSPIDAYSNRWGPTSSRPRYPPSWFDVESMPAEEESDFDEGNRLSLNIVRHGEDTASDQISALERDQATIKPRTASNSSSLRISWFGELPKRTVTANQVKFSRWHNIPQEVLVCVVQQLRTLYNCSSCFNRDAWSIALVNRNWDKAVQAELYRSVYIDGFDSPAQLKRYGMGSGVRLKLLRRTLRERAILARAVRELRVSEPIPSIGNVMFDQIASVVMACPNLESYTGAQQLYNGKYSRLHYALSTRKYLKSHIWIVESSSSSEEDDSLSSQADPSKTLQQFLSLHTDWSSLTTLSLLSQRTANLLPAAIPDLTKFLPCLTSLSISSFPTSSFNTGSLLELSFITLRHIRLCSLPGLDETSLCQLATSTTASTKLESLTLLNTPIHSLYTLSRILSHLQALRTFTFQQFQSLVFPINENHNLILQPLLASKALEFLHWDLPNDNLGLGQLASSISHGGFPSLQKIRCPSDDAVGGIIQSLCTPRAMPEDLPKLSAPGKISGTSIRAVRMRALARQIQILEGKRNNRVPGVNGSGNEPDINSRITIRVTDYDDESDDENENKDKDDENERQEREDDDEEDDDVNAGRQEQQTKEDERRKGEETITWLGYVSQDRNIHYILDSDLGPAETRRWLVEERDVLSLNVSEEDDSIGSGSNCLSNGATKERNTCTGIVATPASRTGLRTAQECAPDRAKSRTSVEFDLNPIMLGMWVRELGGRKKKEINLAGKTRSARYKRQDKAQRKGHVERNIWRGVSIERLFRD
jgi:hypothetical protein